MPGLRLGTEMASHGDTLGASICTSTTGLMASSVLVTPLVDKGCKDIRDSETQELSRLCTSVLLILLVTGTESRMSIEKKLHVS